MPKYRVIAHRRVHNFLINLKDEKLKDQIKTAIEKLENYPICLRDMDVEKIRGLKRTFRIRIREHRIIFQVNKTERTIYVTHTETRKRIYKKLS